MAGRLSWDAIGEHLFETGVDRGVVYPWDSDNQEYTNGVAWNGLTSVSESPSGAEASPLYADNIKYLNLYSAEEFGATIEAYTYPDAFAILDGSVALTDGVIIGQQERKSFGLCYRTKIGSDTEGNNKGYKLHLVYGCQASPSEKAYSTINDSPEAITFSWSINTTPVDVSGYKPTATLVIDSTKVDETKLEAFEDILYGKDASGGSSATIPKLPLPDAVLAHFRPTSGGDGGDGDDNGNGDNGNGDNV